MEVLIKLTIFTMNRSTNTSTAFGKRGRKEKRKKRGGKSDG